MKDLTIEDFKIGMKVSFIDPAYNWKSENNHEVIKVLTPYVYIRRTDGSLSAYLPWRFEIITETQPETFDYLQAMKHYILDQSAELEFESTTCGAWIAVSYDTYCMFSKEGKYRFKPKPVKQTFQFLIKSKGKYSVTKNKYEDEDQVKKGYTYPVEVIQKLEG